MEFVEANGRSGGLLSFWDPNVFRMMGVNKHKHYLLFKRHLLGNNQEINIINVYAPHRVAEKKVLWSSLREVIGAGSGQRVILGDFNAVRSSEERRNSGFNRASVADLNEFVALSGLVEYCMRGRSFTYLAPNSNKISKIDRILVCNRFFEAWPDACLRALPRLHSDHCPLILVTSRFNYGPKPFKFFNSWMGKEGFESVVETAAGSFVSRGGPADVNLTLKLKHIRNSIKSWIITESRKAKEDMLRDKEELENWTV
ncbi:uncharacterized protein LOC110894871 [Helianthus annuus]|uniref:uncharacterized protein LOC110894871 n=1 Tax=Helianthus annuus TaxID=4232 RepID=UPI000B907B99|nr:uncharacterized protein LOC110894871 [Helianthus annuus]